MGKGKKKELTSEEQLLKLLNEGRAPAGPMITSPKLFVHIISLVQFYLNQHQYSQQAREEVARFAFQFRNEALLRYHHDTIETLQLTVLLAKFHERDKERKPQADAVTHIMELADKRWRFSADQLSASEHIRSVWEAFGKGLSLGGGRDLIKVSKSSGASALQPLDVMGEELWEGYKTYFQPWYEKSNKVFIRGLKTGVYLSAAGLIFRVLVEDIYPELLDRAYQFPNGASLKVLHAGLAHYWNPINVGRALKRIDL